MSLAQVALLMALAFASGRILLTWRLRTYIFKPDIKSPPQVPSLIPWVGSALAFTQDPLRFVQRCVRRYGACFTVTVMGKQLTMFTSPALIAALHKSPAASGNDALHAQMLPLLFGLSKTAAEETDVDHQAFYLIRNHLNWERVKILGPSFARSLWTKIATSPAFRSQQLTTISIRTFLAPLFYHGSCAALLGPGFPVDGTYLDFTVFEDNFLSLLSPLPWTGGKARNMRTHLLKAIRGYVDGQVVPASNASTSPIVATPAVPPMITELYELLDTFHYRSDDVSSILLGFLVAFQSNVTLTTFWYLVHILHNHDAHEMLRAEVYRGMADFFSNSVDRLVRAEPEELGAERFPLLASGLDETLRLTTAQPIFRVMAEDTVFSDSTGGLHRGPASYLLRKGQHVYAFSPAVHMDDELYDEPSRFRLDRFLNSDGKGAPTFYRRGKLVANHLLPWGGGVSQCSGRHYAAHVIKITLIMLFHCFDMEGLGAVDRRGKSALQRNRLPRVDGYHIGTVGSPDDYLVTFMPRL